MTLTKFLLGKPPIIKKIIFFHGLGSSADHMKRFFEIYIDMFPGTKFIFPDAKKIPLKVSPEEPLSAWFDITELDNLSEQLPFNIQSAINTVKRNLKMADSSETQFSKTVLAGFSQGGATALAGAIDTDFKIDGICGIGCWVPKNSTSLFTEKKVDENLVKKNEGKVKKTLLIHSSKDFIVPMVNGLFYFFKFRTLKDNLKH